MYSALFPGPPRLIRPRFRGGLRVFVSGVPSDGSCCLPVVILVGSSRLLFDAARGRGRVLWRVLPSLVHGVRPSYGGSDAEQVACCC